MCEDSESSSKFTELVLALFFFVVKRRWEAELELFSILLDDLAGRGRRLGYYFRPARHDKLLGMYDWQEAG
jgi:hypothetical protein